MQYIKWFSRIELKTETGNHICQRHADPLKIIAEFTLEGAKDPDSTAGISIAKVALDGILRIIRRP